VIFFLFARRKPLAGHDDDLHPNRERRSFYSLRPVDIGARIYSADYDGGYHESGETFRESDRR